MANKVPDTALIKQVLQYLDEDLLMEGTWKEVCEAVEHLDCDKQIKEIMKYLKPFANPDAKFDDICKLVGNVHLPKQEELNENSVITMKVNPFDYMNEFEKQAMFDDAKTKLQNKYPDLEFENFEISLNNAEARITSLEFFKKTKKSNHKNSKN